MTLTPLQPGRREWALRPICPHEAHYLVHDVPWLQDERDIPSYQVGNPVGKCTRPTHHANGCCAMKSRSDGELKH